MRNPILLLLCVPKLISARSLIRLGLLVLLLWPQTASAQPSQPDFYLVMQRCTTTIGYLVISDESLKTMAGTPVTNACTRRGKAVTCQLAFQDGAEGHKGNSVDYTIETDSPPLLTFSDPLGSDYIVVDTVQHSAVIVTRIVDRRFAGAKVCQGLFATQSEMEAIGKR